MSEVITLEYPIENNGEQITTLSMRRPKVRDQRLAHKMKGDDSDKEVQLFANLCEVSTDVIDELDAVDYGQLQEQYKDFLSLKKEPSEEPA